VPTDLVLYDNPDSSNGRKVRFALGELSLGYQTVIVPLTGERPGWYRAIHPFATVPALVDDDLVLVESNTMLRYLADRECRDDLYPIAPRDRARVDQLLDVLSLTLRPALWDLELRTHYADSPYYSPIPPSPAEVAAAGAALSEALGGWERLIEADGYLTGTFSIADIAVAARMYLLRSLPFDLSRFPKTQRMLEVVCARPAFQTSI
jgi:glutathione S-transferase